MASCLEALDSAASDSPFERLVALDFYDGPTMGVAVCRGRREAFCFRMLAWDSRQEIRIFSLAELEPPTLADLVRALEAVEPPTWPEWWFQGPKDQTVRDAKNREIDAILRRAKPAAFLVSTEDLLKGPVRTVRIPDAMQARYATLAARRPESAEVTAGTFAEWMEFLAAAQEASGPN